MKDSSKGFFKKVVKKNQVIIAALAVMIIIAGYLNLTGHSDGMSKIEGTETKANKENSMKTEALDDELEEAGSNSLDISDEDIYVQPEIDEIEEPETTETSVDTSVSEETINTEETDIGEAILASTVIGSEFFGNAKLNREQVRASNKETLENIINDVNSTEEARTSASQALIDITNSASLEDELETLLEAKGFEAVCYVDGANVDVVVNSSELRDEDVAKIEDVVMRKAEIDASSIVITNVTTEE